MSGFIMGYEFSNGKAYIEIDNGKVRFWQHVGHPDFVGSLDEFAIEYPALIGEMLQRRVVRLVKVPTKEEVQRKLAIARDKLEFN